MSAGLSEVQDFMENSHESLFQLNQQLCSEQRREVEFRYPVGMKDVVMAQSFLCGKDMLFRSLRGQSCIKWMKYLQNEVADPSSRTSNKSNETAIHCSGKQDQPDDDDE